MELNKSSPIWGKSVNVKVTSTGNILHVFFNNKRIGTQYAKNWLDLTFEAKIRPGKNVIAILSGLVGLQVTVYIFNGSVIIFLLFSLTNFFFVLFPMMMMMMMMMYLELW